MIGHRVILITTDGKPEQYDGVLHRIDGVGAWIAPYAGYASEQMTVFVPMYRIKEVHDKGRAP